MLGATLISYYIPKSDIFVQFISLTVCNLTKPGFKGITLEACYISAFNMLLKELQSNWVHPLTSSNSRFQQ
jgi:hypothetical protein